jgi:hypothetical protein
MYLSSQLKQEVLNRRMVVQASLGKKRDSIYKITRAKRAAGMAQAREYLPRECKT